MIMIQCQKVQFFDNLFVVMYFLRGCVVLATLTLVVKISSSYDFDPFYTGVDFSPYVKHPNTAEEFHPSANIYTTKEIEVMLEVISEKFSRITTWGVGARNDTYTRNETYHISDEEVLVSGVAASINRKSGRKKLTVLQGIRYFDHNPRMKTEMQLAIECAEKANQIFPGTVEAFVFTTEIAKIQFKHAEKTLELLRELKNSSVGNLKFGTRMGGFDLLNIYNKNRFDQNEMQIVTAILQESNFVSCSITLSDEFKLKGAEIAFRVASRALLEIRQNLRQNFTEDKLEIIGEINWDSDGNKSWDTVKNMKVYWENADKWAREVNFPIRYMTAIDIPSQSRFAHAGWWKLTDNSKSDQMAGYFQKIIGISKTVTSTTDGNITAQSNLFTKISMSTVSVVGISLGTISLFIILLILITAMHLRITKLQHKPPKQDI